MQRVILNQKALGSKHSKGIGFRVISNLSSKNYNYLGKYTFFLICPWFSSKNHTFIGMLDQKYTIHSLTTKRLGERFSRKELNVLSDINIYKNQIFIFEFYYLRNIFFYDIDTLQN